jgi:SAM-dependent methyltransferase
MALDTLLRRAEHQALSRVTLHGKVLDLGGDHRSRSRDFIRGGAKFTIVNMSPETKPDILHDLEKPLPFSDTMFDGVLLVNVLEHIFNYQQLLAESARVLKPGGQVVVVVPFLFPMHPSPHDYWRFTGEALAKILADAGFHNIKVEPLGGGVFSARYLSIDRLMPSPIRFLGYYTCRYIALAFDALFTVIARALGKKYDPADYALGYCVTAVAPI